jgi:hypothetical protein
MAFEAPTPASALYNTPSTQASPGGQPPPRSVDRDPRSTPSCGSYGSSSAFQHRRRPSLSQGRTWGRRTLSWRFHWLVWRPELSVVLQPLDRHHLHVAGSGPPRLLSSDVGACSPDDASLRHTPAACLRHAAVRRAFDDHNPACALAYGDPPPHLGPHSLAAGTRPPLPPPTAPWRWLYHLLTGPSTLVHPTTPSPPQACYLTPTHPLPHILPRSSLETVPLYRSPQ